VIVQGRATMSGLPGIRLDLHDSYTVSAVESATHTVSGQSRADHFLTIELLAPLSVDEVFEVTVSWNGRPPDVGGPFNHPSFNWESHGSGADYGPLIYTLSVPYRSGTWWACKEDLTDKATIDIHTTVPDSLVVAANGTLQSIDPAGAGRHTYHWSHASEIAAYLVVIHASNYAQFSDTATIILDPDTGDSTTVDLDYFVYPERLTSATTDFQRMPVAMRFLSDLFGPYPFHAEKYGVAMVNGSFGMEHQTCVSIGNSFIRGVDPDSSLSAEWAFVHELSHHWWGDWITVADWRDVWLNEGFATYTEALWREHVVGELRSEGPDAGFDAYLAYMDRLDVWFPSSQTGFLSAIYDPTPLYGGAPYNKGAWVLHMLRYVVGDEAFFDILPAYVAARGDGNASTEDFIQIAETVSGESLRQFFDQSP